MAFNEVIEAEIGCNCITSGIMPKPGTLQCGNAGMEFRGTDGSRRFRAAWEEVTLVDVDIFRGDIRELAVHIDDGQVVTLIPEDGEALVRAMGAHLGRDAFVSVNSPAGEAEPQPSEPGPLQKLRDRFRRK